MKGKLSARRLRALQAAEHVAMAFRATLAAPAWAPPAGSVQGGGRGVLHEAVGR